MKEVYIVSAGRTPVGSLSGVFDSLTAIDLGKTAINGAIERAGLAHDQAEELFMGNVITANVGQAPARQAALAAGLPKSVPSTAVNKVCASGMKAIMHGVQSILTGDNDIVV
ncbi:MAG: acetyl-CoA C-acyltransferase, partial [Bacteroidetes bacterium SW_11_45_7]